MKSTDRVWESFAPHQVASFLHDIIVKDIEQNGYRRRIYNRARNEEQEDLVNSRSLWHPSFDVTRGVLIYVKMFSGHVLAEQPLYYPGSSPLTLTS